MPFVPDFFLGGAVGLFRQQFRDLATDSLAEIPPCSSRHPQAPLGFGGRHSVIDQVYELRITQLEALRDLIDDMLAFISRFAQERENLWRGTRCSLKNISRYSLMSC